MRIWGGMLLGASVLIFNATPTQAGNLWQAGVWVGWTTVPLADYKAAIETVTVSERQEWLDFLFLVGSTGSASASVDDPSGGLSISGEVKRFLNEKVALGIKGGLVFPPDIVARVRGNGNNGETFTETWALKSSMTSLLVGIEVQSLAVGKKPRFYGDVFLGLVFASSELTWDFSIEMPAFPLSFSQFARSPMKGSAFSADFSGGINFPLDPRGSVLGFLEIGYRLANIQEMELTRNVDTDGDGIADGLKGETATQNGVPLVFDFSGFKAGGGLRLVF